ncbi:bifunctional metallophosphatase/5'-nucleotidase [Paucibacter sp. TC2R-5]|uniref:bifunctional metallophosphatase/5'-nucleotidase n=1 Tax=Paucibacter sp. TC2R-5 TaxID=2893555 RepID=UPI0021E3E0D7|nr:bifunctional metallophosphatase/5'-nucleotidase [Paucibacter sp. TC2R-5]MCV2357612.1 bifunctional metallophosphatase/5'-nucleotidase [Paucibacter sp. TC2R-5]
MPSIHSTSPTHSCARASNQGGARSTLIALAALAVAAMLAACTSVLPRQAEPGETGAAKSASKLDASASPRELSIFSINDFHGHIQPKSPTPLMPRLPDAQTGELKPQAAGGIAYLASAMSKLRSGREHSVFVAAGDLIGASPLYSALLKDEPSLAALGELDLVASALGNHELDAGLMELKRKANGECPALGCAWPEYKGPGFPYLAANMLDAQTGKPVLGTHIIKEVAGFKVAFVGAVTRDTPMVVIPKSIVGLRFADEADTLNALLPQLRAEGAQILVAVMHEGASFNGAANDPSYECPGLQGRGVDIARRLDPAYAIIISGHTHQAYTCKINGRLLVQAGSYGGWVTESRLTLDASGKVLDAQAVNHPVLQSVYTPNPAFVALVQRAAALTAAVRNKPVADLKQGAQRSVQAPFGDSTLGNLIADSQLTYAKKRGPADLALMNTGGIRADLTVEPGRPATMSDLFAIQPFANELVVMTVSGAQLRELLQRQLPKGDGPPRLLQVSSSLRYQYRIGADGVAQLGAVSLGGLPLDDQRKYRLVVNNFMAEGGDGQSVLRQGTERVSVGVDIDAMIELLTENPDAVMNIAPGRIRRE